MATKARSVRIHLNTKDQKLESLQDLLAKVGGLAGCGKCGRIADLSLGI